jgi:hypothetical protein
MGNPKVSGSHKGNSFEAPDANPGALQQLSTCRDFAVLNLKEFREEIKEQFFVNGGSEPRFFCLPAGLHCASR